MRTYQIALLFVGLFFSKSTFAITAEVRTSPATVKASVLRIIMANDQRTSANPGQTDRAAMMIVIGNPKDWHTQIKYKALYEMLWGNSGGYFYDQP